MRNFICFSVVVFSFFFFSSCHRQNPIDTGDSNAGFSLSGKIENWRLGSDKSAALIYYTTTSETSPDAGKTVLFGVGKIDSSGNFAITNVPALPDTLFPMENGRQYNVGLFSDDSLFFHGYTISSISILGSGPTFVTSNLFYSTQWISVLPYVNTTSVVGDYTMMLQYTDRDVTRDSTSTSLGVYDLMFHFTYKVSLKKGWNRIYIITTAVSDSSRSALWTTDAPSTTGKWYYSSRYFKMKF